jgi:hypothetical protein
MKVNMKKKKDFGTKTLESMLKQVKSMSVKEYKKLSEELKDFVGDDNQDCCMGFGLWAIGDACPMGPMDASDGCPTIACPECGADANPIKPVKKTKISRKKK